MLRSIDKKKRLKKEIPFSMFLKSAVCPCNEEFQVCSEVLPFVIKCTCQDLQHPFCFIAFVGWNSNSSLERTETPCQVLAELYQVS